ncbi:hypothetical protein GCM10008013_27900 [Paenibacillus segetis]|uniref:Uncharacterized protein n=1 Tax=Paenibacillus segetis TaxID=1325360 RepID=A0ABQ1YJV2_9BACL|nr:hypothetical protein GCM10008013_27900 [Paenibacillus segetis]
MLQRICWYATINLVIGNVTDKDTDKVANFLKIFLVSATNRLFL